MGKIISTYIEEPHRRMYFVVEKQNKNNLCLAPVDLIPVHKVVRMFDEEGTMCLRHYDEDEWYNFKEVALNRYHSLDAYCEKRGMCFNLLLRYFNWYLEDAYIADALEEIKQEDLNIKYSELGGYCKDIVDELDAWIKSGQQEPFTSEIISCSCRKLKNDDDTDGADAWYEIDYFGVKKEDK